MVNETQEQNNIDNPRRVIDVTDRFAGQAHDRFISGVSDTQALLGHMTFTEDEKVTAIRFKLNPKTGVPALGDIVRVVFDATPVDDIADDAQAWAYLADAVAAPDIDVEYKELTFVPKASLTDADGHWSRWFEFAAPLRAADFRYMQGAAGTKDLDIIAEVG